MSSAFCIIATELNIALLKIWMIVLLELNYYSWKFNVKSDRLIIAGLKILFRVREVQQWAIEKRRIKNLTQS